MEEQSKVVNGAAEENTPSSAVVKQESQVVPVDNVFSSERGISRINLLNEAEVARAKAFLTEVMRSDKGGIKSVNDGLAVIMRAQDLNLPFSTALEHVHVINGKTGIDIHVVKALLLRAGVTWECLNDYTPLYEYTDSINVYVDGSFPDYLVRCKSSKEAEALSAKEGNEDKIFVYPVKYYQDFNGNIYKDYQMNAQFTVVINKAQATKALAEKKIPVIRIPAKPVDYITKYKFTRVINGVIQNSIGTFTYLEAITAGMFEKDTYKKYPKVLIGHRAFSYGARDIASDVILGAYETTELKIMTGTDLNNNDYVDVQ